MKSHYWETSGGDTELYLAPADEEKFCPFKDDEPWFCPICGERIDECGHTEEDWQALNYPGY